ncbi:MAG: hypothetical protein PUJ19_03060 [Campylobacteraceae bacterium]|nr:hypothetical protein [Campylobacteraceae bacterium]MDY4121489.1 hypothetical protein [Campylobacter sp.]
MAKKTKIDYLPLFEKYERGELTATQIAKDYGLNRSSFIQCYNRYKAGLDENISNTAEHLDKGLTALRQAQENIKAKETEAETLTGEKRERALREARANRQALMSSLDILEKHHGALAQAAISVVGKGIKKANDLLDIVESPSEYAAIMSGLKSSVDSIGLFPRPKAPLVAIQNNINSETGADNKKKDFEIKINFLNSKQEKKKDEVIDAEVEND